MTNFSVEFFKKNNGDIPAEIFLNSMDVKMRVRAAGLLKILQEKGNLMREPYSKHLEDGIFELRVNSGNNISRLLYFFYYKHKIIITNGFVKKTNKTPRNQIDKAKQYRKDYLERMSDNEKI